MMTPMDMNRETPSQSMNRDILIPSVLLKV